MLIKIRYPNTITVMISFVQTWWIINEFEKYQSTWHVCKNESTLDRLSSETSWSTLAQNSVHPLLCINKHLMVCLQKLVNSWLTVTWDGLRCLSSVDWVSIEMSVECHLSVNQDSTADAFSTHDLTIVYRQGPKLTVVQSSEMTRI